MRVSGENRSGSTFYLCALDRARVSRRSTTMLLANTRPIFQCELARFTMIPWTTQEISVLIGLWPNASAAQISKRLNRSRASVCGKAMRLRSDDLLPADVEKHFEVNPAVQTRPGRAQTTGTSITPAKPTPPVDATVPPPKMRRCSLVELDDGQCRWPLGTVAEVATLFCGGAVEPGRAYCGHHWRMACG